MNINIRANIILNRAEVKSMLLPKDPIGINPPTVITAQESERRIDLAKSFKGGIVNITSVSGFRSLDGVPGGYTISKHAMIGLTKVMGTKYGPQGIRTNAIAPGLDILPFIA